MKITKEQARRFLIKYQGLAKRNDSSGKEAIKSYIKKVGCIQYDPLNVVGRNPDLVLQSRIKDYKKEMLESLLYEERALIDAWDKMMAIYSIEDYPYFKRVRKRKDEEVKNVLKNRNSIEALELVDDIREILKEKGPMQSSKIDVGRGNEGRWGHKKLSSAALDYMFNIGEIGVKDKKNTQKIYDLIEKLIPEKILKTEELFDTDEDFYKWYVKRRISSVGMLWNKNGGGWLGHFISKKNIRNKALKELIEEGQIVEFEVEGIKESFYVKKEDLDLLLSKDKIESESVKIIAPLDNLIWDRALTKELFDFEYSWEVYVPKVKRKYGYYVLPVLYKDKFIARFEAEKYRGEEELIIKNWWWEKDVEIENQTKKAIEEGMKEFCRYLGANKVNLDIIEKKTT